MGKVTQLEVMAKGISDQVRVVTLGVLEKSGDENIILSGGGGISPGIPCFACFCACDDK